MKWSDDFVSSLLAFWSVIFNSPLLFQGFLTTELDKAGIEPRPAGNVEAPDPQKMIDLEVNSSLLCSTVLHFTSHSPSLKFWRWS